MDEIKHLNTQNDIDELRTIFDGLVVKPKLVTLGEALENDWEPKPKDHLRLAKHLLENKELEPVVAENFREKMSIHKYNENFHATKLIWLINEIRTKGLYSVPQAWMNGNKWKVHPGTHRVHALIHLNKLDQEFVLWDKESTLNNPLDFDTWLGLFSKSDNNMFAVLKPNILEMHVSEDRNEMYANSIKVMQTVKEIKFTEESLLNYSF
jgi:hypothetical protein